MIDLELHRPRAHEVTPSGVRIVIQAGQALGLQVRAVLGAEGGAEPGIPEDHVAIASGEDIHIPVYRNKIDSISYIVV